MEEEEFTLEKKKRGGKKVEAGSEGGGEGV